MSLSRRDAILGATALALVSGGTARAAAAGSRDLVLYRGDSRIGGKTVSVRQDGDDVAVETRIEIDVKLLGLSAYRYQLTAREAWRQGALQSLQAETDDDGTPHFATAERVAGELRIAGSVYSGPAPGNPATTSYWSPAFLERPVWISTQDGRLLNVTATNLGATAFPAAGGSIEAARWRIGGDLTDLFLYYDAAGEWVGSEFTAEGETARFVAVAGGPALTPLWVNA